MDGITRARGTQIGVSSILALALLATAAISLVWFSAVAGLSFLFAAFMGWSRPFEDNRAKGKPTLSAGGRFGVGACFAVIGVLFLWLPRYMAVDTSRDYTSAMSSDKAAPICESAARDRIVHPSTADFSILGRGFKSFDDGTAIFATTFTARNSFNLELEYQVACDFTGSTLTDVKIVEAR